MANIGKAKRANTIQDDCIGPIQAREIVLSPDPEAAARYLATVFVEIQALAIVYYAINKKKRMPECEAKGDAIYLAHVVATRARKGWSGTQANPDKSPQVVSSKFYSKDGVYRVSKTFGHVLMNEDRYDAMVSNRIGPGYGIIVKTAKALVGIGTDLDKIKESIQRMLEGKTH